MYGAGVSKIEMLGVVKHINKINEALSKKYPNVKYLYADFKKKDGYKRSLELSKEYGLYRQEYCGCVYSKQERETIVKI